MNSRRRVVITGIGLVTPLAPDREGTWRRVLAGESAAGKITQFDASTWPVTIACEVKDFTLNPQAVLAHQHLQLSRPSEFGMEAALEAVRDAGLEGRLNPDRTGVIMGTGIGAIKPVDVVKLFKTYQVQPGFAGMAAHLELEKPASSILDRNHPCMLSHLLAERWQAWALCKSISTACSAAAQAIGEGMRVIRAGDADVMMVGGADSLSGELLLAGFCLLGVLSKRTGNPAEASRPFDKDRDGFVCSEGAAVLMLEEAESAMRRGARIYAELAGYCDTENAFRLTDLPEDGRGAVAAMSGALADAGMRPLDIRYINAHGTSTDQNDRIEAIAIRRVFGAQGVRPMISSTKSEIGHLVAAAGGVEAAFTALAVHHGKVPPTRCLYQTNCGEDLDFVARTMRVESVHGALSNSFGFGGTNACLAFRRWSP